MSNPFPQIRLQSEMELVTRWAAQLRQQGVRTNAHFIAPASLAEQLGETDAISQRKPFHVLKEEVGDGIWLLQCKAHLELLPLCDALLGGLAFVGADGLPTWEWNALRQAARNTDLLTQLGFWSSLSDARADDLSARRAFSVGARRYASYTTIGAIASAPEHCLFVAQEVPSSFAPHLRNAIAAARSLLDDGRLPRGVSETASLHNTLGDLLVFANDFQAARAAYRAAGTKAAESLSSLDGDPIAARMRLALRGVRGLAAEAEGYGPGMPFLERG